MKKRKKKEKREKIEEVISQVKVAFYPVLA